MVQTLIYRPRRWNIVAGDPAREPVSLEEIKALGNFEAADDDALLAGWLKTARMHVEAMTHRALITKAYTYKIDRFPDDPEQVIELPGGNLQALTSITYTDTAGAPQTWAASNYVAATERGTGRVGLAYGAAWPDVREWGLAVTVSYTAGYGDDQGDVPEPLRTAITLIASDLEMNRENSANVEMHLVMMDARRLTAPFRLMRMI